MKVVQVFRKKDPRFFSIESVFYRIRTAWPTADVPGTIIVPYNGIAFSNLFYLFRESRQRKETLFHVTGAIHYVVLALPRKKTVLTIHDCVFIRQHSGLKRWLLKKILLDFPLWYLPRITTISEKTRQEIIGNTRCRPDKITVIPNPVSDIVYFRPKLFNTQCPVLLFIGITPNKNLERVCEAVRHIESKLVIIGKLSEKQSSILNFFGIRYEASDGISDQEMADKYAEADIVLFPSLYEGFGLPVIEGFKAGRVVITSNISPMKEVSDNAACLVDPYSVSSIQEGLLRIIQDQRYRDDLIQRGFQVAKKYQPEIIAEQYYQLYDKMYDNITVK